MKEKKKRKVGKDCNFPCNFASSSNTVYYLCSFLLTESFINANYEGDGSKEMVFVSLKTRSLPVFGKIRKGVCDRQTHFRIESLA